LNDRKNKHQIYKIKTYINPVLKKTANQLELDLQKPTCPNQNSNHGPGARVMGKGYFIRQPSTGLQQQHLNTKRKFSPVQGSLLEHSIRLILRY